MANIAPIISEHKALEVPRLTAKAPRKSELEFLKTPPQATTLEQPIDAPSELHFTQFAIGGAQITSLMIWGVGGLTLTSKCFRMTNSDMEAREERGVRLPDMFVLDIIKFFAVLMLMILS